jgi:hypothetical protein
MAGGDEPDLRPEADEQGIAAAAERLLGLAA